MEYIEAPGSEGYFGALANHAALISAPTSGSLKARLAGGAEAKWQVSGGFFEVSNNKATVLADDVKQSKAYAARAAFRPQTYPRARGHQAPRPLCDVRCSPYESQVGGAHAACSTLFGTLRRAKIAERFGSGATSSAGFSYSRGTTPCA